MRRWPGLTRLQQVERLDALAGPERGLALTNAQDASSLNSIQIRSMSGGRQRFASSAANMTRLLTAMESGWLSANIAHRSTRCQSRSELKGALQTGCVSSVVASMGHW